MLPKEWKLSELSGNCRSWYQQGKLSGNNRGLLGPM
uniref:Uncharacterized protein n=1 Tax=Arundo donax TaxID=35708 RepID=A0A0A9CAZ2_ARUDO